MNMKLERIQIFADFTGTLSIEKFQAFDATVTVHEITEEMGRGPLRPIDLMVELDTSKLERLNEAITILNEVFSDGDSAQSRIAAAKSKLQADREAKAAEEAAREKAKAEREAAIAKRNAFQLETDEAAAKAREERKAERQAAITKPEPTSDEV
jgi:hypothetical protein